MNAISQQPLAKLANFAADDQPLPRRKAATGFGQKRNLEEV
jgi:hypothetical protein